MTASDAQGLSIPQPELTDCLRHGWQSLLANPAVLLVLGFGLLVLHGVGDGLVGTRGIGTLLGLGVMVLAYRPLQWGFAYLCLRSVRGDDVEANDVLVAMDRYAEVVIAHVLIAIMVVVGLCLLVVPGVWIYARTRFTPYLVVEDELSAGDAIRESIRLTHGHTATILGIIALGCLAIAAGAIPFGLGIVPASVWWNLSLASLYHAAVVPGDLGEASEGPYPEPDPEDA